MNIPILEKLFNRRKRLDSYTYYQWTLLPSKDRLSILLLQTEWMLFQALLLGISIDQRLLTAVAEARRVASGCTTNTKIIQMARRKALDVFFENGGHTSLKKQKYLNGCTVAYLCLCIADDAMYETMNRLLPGHINGSIYYDLLRMGSILKESPLSKWIDENDTVSITH